MPSQSTKATKRQLSHTPVLDPSISHVPKKEGGAWLGVEPPSGHQDVPPSGIPLPRLALKVENFVRRGNHDEVFSEECSPREFEAIKDAAEDGCIGPDSERIRLEYLDGKLMVCCPMLEHEISAALVRSASSRGQVPLYVSSASSPSYLLFGTDWRCPNYCFFQSDAIKDAKTRADHHINGMPTATVEVGLMQLPEALALHSASWLLGSGLQTKTCIAIKIVLQGKGNTRSLKELYITQWVGGFLRWAEEDEQLDDLKGKILILHSDELVAATPSDKTCRYLAVDTAMDEETGKVRTRYIHAVPAKGVDKLQLYPPGCDTHTDTINFAKHWFIRDTLEQDSMEETFFSIIPEEIIAIVQKNIELDNAKDRPNDTLGADQRRDADLSEVVKKRTLEAFKASVELQGLPALKKRILS
ncbi:unnamed protein product [Cyclocybe aegerita]|uniref:Uncharacterized protein n=1 Tax=Cyclocybe aegerita TaxID=1973307 RepID=A0A8S0VTQ1_CYCAE|nr:unnamed protein product [Cyclocybe aegerita]